MTFKPKPEIKPQGHHALIKYEGVGPATKSTIAETGECFALYDKRDILNASCTTGPQGLQRKRYGVSPQ